MTGRRAITLVELLVALPACTFILTLSAKLMHQAMRSQERTRSFLNLERTAQRLSHRFRADARQALSALTAASELPAGVLLRLRWSESQFVEYREQGGTVTRTVVEGDKVLSRDDFALYPGISCAVNRQESPPLLGLTITRPPAGAAPASMSGVLEHPLRLQVEARLGGDHRHAGPRMPQERVE